MLLPRRLGLETQALWGLGMILNSLPGFRGLGFSVYNNMSQVLGSNVFPYWGLELRVWGVRLSDVEFGWGVGKKSVCSQLVI